MMRADPGTVQKRLLKWLNSVDSEKKRNANIEKGWNEGMNDEWKEGGEGALPEQDL